MREDLGYYEMQRLLGGSDRGGCLVSILLIPRMLWWLTFGVAILVVKTAKRLWDG